MKKMMFMVAAFMAVATLQAASINWAIGNTAITGMDGVKNLVGREVYLITADYITALEGEILGGTFSSASTGVLEATTTIANNKGRVDPHVLTHSSLDAGTWYDFVVLTFDTFGGVDYYQFSSALNAAGYTDGEDEPEMIAFGAGAFNPSNWQAVPEPTSVALLALGVAALGLRRRRA